MIARERWRSEGLSEGGAGNEFVRSNDLAVDGAGREAFGGADKERPAKLLEEVAIGPPAPGVAYL